MARRPATAGRSRRGQRPHKDRRRPSALAIVSLAVIAAVGVVVGWLAVTFDEAAYVRARTGPEIVIRLPSAAPPRTAEAPAEPASAPRVATIPPLPPEDDLRTTRAPAEEPEKPASTETLLAPAPPSPEDATPAPAPPEPATAPEQEATPPPPEAVPPLPVVAEPEPIKPLPPVPPPAEVAIRIPPLEQPPRVILPEQPRVTEPPPTVPAPTEPQPAEPQPAEPQTTEPQTAEPQPAEPQPAEPQPAEPQTTEPQTTEPQTTEPQTTEPQPAEPQTAEPSRAEPASPPKEEVVALAVAPDPDLIVETPKGPLPVVAPDGRQAWRVYRRPFHGDDTRPRIAIVVAGMGLSQSAANAAIQQLPGAVTLAFAPYARDLTAWIAQARAAGHEVLLQLPMEPNDYPTNDPGPYTLLTSLSDEDNLDRLGWLLSRFTGYVGVTNYMGSRFTSSEEHIRPVLDVLKKRGLMFLDSRSSQSSVAGKVASEIGLPRALNNRFLDNVASRPAIDARLDQLERIARVTGFAIGIGFPYPVTIERVATWAATLERKGIVLVPVTAIVDKQSG